jgi:hypothetical protein
MIENEIFQRSWKLYFFFFNFSFPIWWQMTGFEPKLLEIESLITHANFKYND